MTALRVGMRVKKVRGEANVGLIGVVVDFNPGAFTRDCDMRVRAESPAINTNHDLPIVALPVGTIGSANSSEWEPIQPEGYQVVPWSSCLWMPSHMRDGVAA